MPRMSMQKKNARIRSEVQLHREIKQSSCHVAILEFMVSYKINKICMNFHKILLKFTKIRMDFQLTNFFGEFYMIFSLSGSLLSPSRRALGCR
jgi:hypothetical protein